MVMSLAQDCSCPSARRWPLLGNGYTGGNGSAGIRSPLLAFTGLWQSPLLARHATPANMPSEAVMRIGSALLLIWLVIGAIAGGQRHYYAGSDPNCAQTDTIIVTVLAGPAQLLWREPESTLQNTAAELAP